MILGLKGTLLGQLSAVPGAYLDNLQVAELVVELHCYFLLDDHKPWLIDHINRVFVVT